jgi:hypothetical protein
MDAIKQKYIKDLRKQVRDQEKWRDEAEDLLRKNGNVSPEEHLSILQYRNTIRELQDKIDNFSEEDDDFMSFFERHDKKTTTKLDSGNNKSSGGHTGVKKNGGFDRWADVKAQNAMRREWNWLCRMDGFLPEHMRENLLTMPNNRGFIWKGIHYYGHRKCEEPINVITLFEKQHQLLYIHEISPQYYRIYEKKDKQKPKTLCFEKLYETSRI